MIKIDCAGCNNCCQNSQLNPVLLPSEELKFKKNSRKFKTPYREMFVLRKKENGNCVFLDDKMRRCTIYNKRPLECILYPFLLDLSKTPIDVELDKRFCPHLQSLIFNKRRILAFVRKNHFPHNWIKSYERLDL